MVTGHAGNSLFFFFWCSETKFLYVALTDLELPLKDQIFKLTKSYLPTPPEYWE